MNKRNIPVWFESSVLQLESLIQAPEATALDFQKSLFRITKMLFQESKVESQLEEVIETLKELVARYLILKNYHKKRGEYVTIHNCSMPVFLMRGTQSSKLLTQIIPGANAEELVVKKKER